eukprot:12347216-Alexandrium_andersonii.AAC.1
MSASLVGSEMCIRDRGRALTFPYYAACAPNTQCGGMPRRGGDMAGHMAVSYTHLTLPTICSV